MIRQQLIEQLMPKLFVEKTLSVQSGLMRGTDKDGRHGYDN